MVSGRVGLLVGPMLLFLAMAMALGVSADPDPPNVDGGTTTFFGDWMVDGGDHLVYKNQTIILNGNLYVDPDGILELVNTTLALNSTVDGEFSLIVRSDGRLNLTTGAALDAGVSGHRWYGLIEPSGHLLLLNSSVARAGYSSPLGYLRAGLLSNASDTVIEGSDFTGCYAGIVLAGGSGARIANSTFGSSEHAGVWVVGNVSDLDLYNVTFSGCKMGMLATNCRGIRMEASTFSGGEQGIVARNASVQLEDGIFEDQSVHGLDSQAEAVVDWNVTANARVVNTTVSLNGTLKVASGAMLNVTNSTLSILNRLVDGEHGITVEGGGTMQVLSNSRVDNGTAPYHFGWAVMSGARLELVSSTLVGAGWNDSAPGLVLLSSSNELKKSAIRNCHYGLSVREDSNVVSELSLRDCVVGLYWNASGAIITQVATRNCSRVGIWLDDGSDFIITTCSGDQGGCGIRISQSVQNVRITTYDAASLTVGVNTTGSNVDIWDMTTRDCGVAIELSGDFVTVDKLECTTSGTGPAPRVGVMVNGTASNVDLSSINVSGFPTGFSVNGWLMDTTVKDLNVTGATVAGVSLQGAFNVDLYNLSLSVSGGTGVILSDSQWITVDHARVVGTPSKGIDISQGSRITLKNLTLRAIGDQVTAAGGASSRNLTVIDGDFDGGQYGVRVQGFTDVLVLNTSISNTSSTGVWASQVQNLTVRACNIVDAGAVGIYVSNAQDIMVELCNMGRTDTLVRMENVLSPSLRTLMLTDAEQGIVLERCNEAIFFHAVGLNLTVSVELNGTVTTMMEMCSFDGSQDVGFLLVNGTVGCVIANCTVTSSGTAVRLEDPLTRANRIENLGVVNCTMVVNATGAGDSNVLETSLITGIPRAVSATGGSELEIRDCSFFDCLVAIESDNASWVNWTAEGACDLVNASATFRGRVLVATDGSLNLSAANVTLLSNVWGESSIKSEVDSTLRILRGSRIAAGRGSAPFTIISEGSLEARGTLIEGGGLATEGSAALNASGDAALIVNLTFRDCGLALEVSGSFATIRNCTFEGNGWSVNLVGALRPMFNGCVVRSSGSVWDLNGTFDGSLQLLGCTFEGGGTAPYGALLQSETTSPSPVTIRNCTFANYTTVGLNDDHRGPLLMEDCNFTSAPSVVGARATYNVQLRRLQVFDCMLSSGFGALVCEDSTFERATLGIIQANLNAVVRRCEFRGNLSPRDPSVWVVGSRAVGLYDLTIDNASIGVTVSEGSDATLVRCVISRAHVSAVEVNGSMVKMKDCQISGLLGNGLRCWGAGSTLEVGNSTVSADEDRTGLDVDASGLGDVLLVNTTFNRTSTSSVMGGRIEVTWPATLELRLPWGGTVHTVTLIVVEDGLGDEVFNASRADEPLWLKEFKDEDGERTWHTPHWFRIEDIVRGVNYSKAHTVNASLHLVLALEDVRAPVARAGRDLRENEDTLVELNATTSSDNDPTFPASGTFLWTFEEYDTPVVLWGIKVSYVFNVPGQFNITLTVTDAAGNPSTDQVIVQVIDRTPPVIHFIGNTTIDEDKWEIFDASATTDNDPTFNASSGRFSWSISRNGETWTWDTATFGNAFNAPGNYSGTLTVWDKEDNNAVVSFWILVRDRTPPTIVGVHDAIVFEPTSGLLDANGCSDNVGIVSWEWTVTFNGSSRVLYGATPAYTFTELGSYEATLVLRDAVANENSTTITVVYDDVPVISLPEQVVAMVGEPVSVPVLVFDLYHTLLRITVASGPEGATVEGGPDSPVLSWTPGDEHADLDVVIEVEVFDGFKSSQVGVLFTVNPGRGVANRPPEILSEPPRSARKATPYIYGVDAVDPDGDRLGYMLVEAPDGMSVSVSGTISWDPPFESGIELVNVHLVVTDGRSLAHQEWDIRWRDPPNQPPFIDFELPEIEVKVREEFLVDLGTHLPTPGAFDVDPDDANSLLEWVVGFDRSRVTLISVNGLVFTLQAKDTEGPTQINFTVIDPSGERDTTSLVLVIIDPSRAEPSGDASRWPLLLMLAILIVMGILGGMVAMRRREAEFEEPDLYGADVGGPPTFEPPVDETAEGAEELASALGPPGTGDVGAPLDEGAIATELEEVEGFVEVEGVKTEAPVVEGEGPPPLPPGVTRVVGKDVTAVAGDFVIDGISILGRNFQPLTSTGKMDEAMGPLGDRLGELLRGRDGEVALEVEGRRVLALVGEELGLLCLVRGREDLAFIVKMEEALQKLREGPLEDVALEVTDDLLASAKEPESADVVRGAWTARLRSRVTFKGSMLNLEISFRNETDQVMNNTRLAIQYDEDALSIDHITPNLLESQGVLSIGNIPPGKERAITVTFAPEICISSMIKMVAQYTDFEGRRVIVPTRPRGVNVECPFVEPSGKLPEGELLSLAEDSQIESGRRVYRHGHELDRMELYRLAVAKVIERGLMKVLTVDEGELMRSETWLMGTGIKGTPRVLARVATHGADGIIEVFVASDDSATATGLLTRVAGEFVDAVASEFPGSQLESVQDAPTIEDIAAWPTLLDYKVMGD